jgi:drug/metabolite transporter (DMT)-like permease
VLIFALTLPATRLAVGDLQAPQLPPAFVTAGRAAVAGLLAAAYLRLVGASRPPRSLWPVLALSALGTVLGFPLGLALALREVPAMHAAVVTGVLPLATAVAAALALRQRASVRFWAVAAAGCATVLAFAAVAGGGQLHRADAFLLMAVLSGAVGYVAGARATQQIPAQQTIGWVLVLALPLTLPMAVWLAPAPADAARVGAAAWTGFAYVCVFSMWLGFFAWYRALALGGVLRVSQVQLLQPFLALLLAVPLCGEPLQPLTLGFTLLVMALVALGRRMPVGTAGVPAAARASLPTPDPPTPATTPPEPRHG